MRGDVQKKMLLEGRRGFGSWLRCQVSAGGLAVTVYRLGQLGKEAPHPLLGLPFKLVYFPLFYLVQALTGISIQLYSTIGRRFAVLNHTCIFVAAERIGDDFTVCQGVTVGNVRGQSRLPVIGDRVFLEPGCKVLGAVTIGDDVVVRANSLVLSDVPKGSVAVGNPARIMPLEPQ